MHRIRLMEQVDIPGVMRVQSECYSPLLQESETTLRSRLSLSPDSAWVAEDKHGICAYLVAYYSVLGKVTPLGGLFDISHSADSLYLHDLAVARRCTAQGMGRAMVAFACEQAQRVGLIYSTLVSVQGSKDFWLRLGYYEWDGLDPVQRANVQTYGPPSVYMIKRLV